VSQKATEIPDCATCSVAIAGPPDAKDIPSDNRSLTGADHLNLPLVLSAQTAQRTIPTQQTIKTCNGFWMQIRLYQIHASRRQSSDDKLHNYSVIRYLKTERDHGGTNIWPVPSDVDHLIKTIKQVKSSGVCCDTGATGAIPVRNFSMNCRNYRIHVNRINTKIFQDCFARGNDSYPGALSRYARKRQACDEP
jgi:hypothetical protein